jgi:hypothetical protein
MPRIFTRCPDCHERDVRYCAHYNVLFVYIGGKPVWIRSPSEERARQTADRVRVALTGKPFNRKSTTEEQVHMNQDIEVEIDYDEQSQRAVLKFRGHKLTVDKVSRKRATTMAQGWAQHLTTRAGQVGYQRAVEDGFSINRLVVMPNA